MMTDVRYLPHTNDSMTPPLTYTTSTTPVTTIHKDDYNLSHYHFTDDLLNCSNNPSITTLGKLRDISRSIQAAGTSHTSYDYFYDIHTLLLTLYHHQSTVNTKLGLHYMTTVDEVCLMVTGISHEEPYPPHPDYPHLYSRTSIQNTLIDYINLNPHDNKPTQSNPPTSPPDTTTSSPPTTPPSSSPSITTMIPSSSSLHKYTKLSLTLSLTLVLTLLLYLYNTTYKATPSILLGSTHDTPTTYHHPISLLTLPYLSAIIPPYPPLH